MGLTFHSETQYSEPYYDGLLSTNYPTNHKQYISGVPLPPGVEIKLYKYSDKPNVVGLQFYYKGKSTTVQHVSENLSELACQKLVIKLLQEIPGLDPKLYTNEYFFTAKLNKTVKSNHSWPMPNGYESYDLPKSGDDVFKHYTYEPSKGDWDLDFFGMKYENPGNIKVSDSLSRKSSELPGITTLVDTPCSFDCRFAMITNLSGGKPTLHSVIMHLNDEHKWTREAIADWVDTIPNLMQDFTPIEPDRA